MKADYVKPITDATLTVFQNMFQTELTMGETTVLKDAIPARKANILIGVTGQLKGSLVFSLTEAMALGIVEEMAGMKMDRLDKFVTSAIGELANIISGHAMTNLTAIEYLCDIIPPQVIVGDNQEIFTATEDILLIPFTSRFGEFDLHISLLG